ncbi:hypothetical protein ASF37_13635 [Aeromicrobium sp. Leaf289]|uniref:sunset domain-containing protein n=1 Tax=Aeromicrobium sp. Leaf289 TaxID=1736324 RepID=UPI0006F74C9E|nr:hypothetical protein [Aeromicrobium sp. Leaf289]KQP75980.1 hypothetical protein ASF37_13635 [Aeromicrobium sp. Leaf289]
MSVYTAGEIVVWLVLAAALGVALGWLLGSRRGAARGTGTGSTTSTDRWTVPGPETRYGSSDPVRPRPAAQPDREPDREPERPAPGSVGPFRGSALPGPGGGSPGPGYEVKANVDSLTYYLPGSPAHARVTADVWFKDAEAARTAGFRPPPSQG